MFVIQLLVQFLRPIRIGIGQCGLLVSRRHFEMTFDARMPTSNIVFFFLFDDDVDESDSCMSNEQKEEFDEDEEDYDKHLHLYTRVDL